MVAFVAALADAFKTFVKAPVSMLVRVRTGYHHHQPIIRYLRLIIVSTAAQANNCAAHGNRNAMALL